MFLRTGMASVFRWVVAVSAGVVPATASAGEIVNGYTYVAPSYYLTPPVIVSGSVYVAPVPVRPRLVIPVTAPEPFATPYVYHAPPASTYRDRVTVRPREIEYNARSYGPYGERRRTHYEVEWNRRGVEIEYRSRRR
ncbi:MAG: hypothetical protein SFV23_11175 [Planctomycetaceae bacterium]|nr:hypothetical protein [Planctomycetaceae bacterium]